MPDNPEHVPECFGKREKVCSRNEDGFIEPNVECVRCKMLKRCLRKALEKDGVLDPPLQETPIVRKTRAFLSRWSRLKREKGRRGR